MDNSSEKLNKKPWIRLGIMIFLYILPFLFVLGTKSDINTVGEQDNSVYEDTMEEEMPLIDDEQSANQAEHGNVIVSNQSFTNWDKRVLLLFLFFAIFFLCIETHFDTFKNPMKGIHDIEMVDYDFYFFLIAISLFSIITVMILTDYNVNGLFDYLQVNKMPEIKSGLFYKIWNETGMDIIIKIFVISKFVKYIYDCLRKDDKYPLYEDIEGNVISFSYFFSFLLVTIIMSISYGAMKRSAIIIVITFLKHLAILIGGFYWFDKDINEKYGLKLGEGLENIPSIVWIIFDWIVEAYILDLFSKSFSMFLWLWGLTLSKVIFYFASLIIQIKEFKKSKICIEYDHSDESYIDKKIILNHSVRYNGVVEGCEYTSKCAVFEGLDKEEPICKDNSKRHIFIATKDNTVSDQDNKLSRTEAFSFELDYDFYKEIDTIFIKDELFEFAQIKKAEQFKEYSIKENLGEKQ